MKAYDRFWDRVDALPPAFRIAVTALVSIAFGVLVNLIWQPFSWTNVAGWAVGVIVGVFAKFFTRHSRAGSRHKPTL